MRTHSIQGMKGAFVENVICELDPEKMRLTWEENREDYKTWGDCVCPEYFGENSSSTAGENYGSRLRGVEQLVEDKKKSD